MQLHTYWDDYYKKKVKTQKISIGKDVAKLEHCTLLMGMQNGAAIVENSLVVPQRAKYRITIWPTIPLSRYISKTFVNTDSNRCLYTTVHCSIIRGSSCEDMITDWPMSRTWAMGSCPWNVHSKMGAVFPGHSLERAMCYWDHLDGIRDWT